MERMSTKGTLGREISLNPQHTVDCSDHCAVLQLGVHNFFLLNPLLQILIQIHCVIFDTPAFEVLTKNCLAYNCFYSYNPRKPKTLQLQKKTLQLKTFGVNLFITPFSHCSVSSSQLMFCVLDITLSLSHSLLQDNIQCRAKRRKHMFIRAKKNYFRSFTFISKIPLNPSHYVIDGIRGIFGSYKEYFYYN